MPQVLVNKIRRIIALRLSPACLPRGIFTSVITFLLLLFASPGFSGTLEWQATDAGSGEALCSDSGYTSKLPEGCLVQLILDIDGSGLNSIENTGSINPAGTNILMPLTSGDNTGSIGANMPFDKEGHFIYSVGFSESSYNGKTVYVRFWNSSSPGVGSNYGESSGYTLQNIVTPQLLNILSSGSLYTNKTLSSGEEPTTTTTTLTVKVYDADTNTAVSSPTIKLYKSYGLLVESAANNPHTFTVNKNSDYYVRIEKQGYIFPSNKISSAGDGTHGEIFTVGVSAKELNIPIDRGNILTIDYASNKKQVVKGDIVTFSVSVQNNSSLAQDDIVLEASKMNAVKYTNGTAYFNGQKINVTESGGKYVFSLGSLGANSSANLLYQAVVSVGANIGEYNSVAVAYRQSTSDQLSNSDEVKIVVGEDALMDKGTIIGKVFWDNNADGIQDQETPAASVKQPATSDERGIADVKIVTEYGVIVTTDKNGMYHIPDVPVGRHILKVIDKTLPEQNIIILENPRWIETTPGILNKVNFSVMRKQEEKKEEGKKEDAEKAGKKEPEKPKEKFSKKETEKIRQDKKEKIIEKKVEETSPDGKHVREEKYELVEKEVEETGPDGRKIKKKIKGYVKTEFVGEVEVIEEEQPSAPQLEPAKEVVLVKEEGLPQEKPEEPDMTGKTREIYKLFRDTFVVAYVEGTLKQNHVTGNQNLLAGGDRTLKDGWWGDGRLAFTLLSKLFDKIDLTASLDTDRIKTAAKKVLARQKIMTNLDEDQFYPIYGDASQIDYSAADTQDILYAKAKMGESEAVWGGYKTEMPLYQKAYNGGNVKYRSEAQTKFGENKTELDAFVAKDYQTASHEEFIGTGGSLYYLKNREVIEGSEQLRILIKDRLTNRVLKAIPLKEESDFTIDYFTGRILLNKPLNSVSFVGSDSVISNDILAGNQAVLSVDYVFWNDDGKYNSYGGRIKQNITDYLTVEGMYVEEEKAEKPFKLYGGGATIRINQDTFVSGRYSKSEETTLASGMSYNGGFDFVLNSSTWSDDKQGDEIDLKGQTVLLNKINIEAGYTDTDPNFNTTESLDRSGRKVLFANIITPLTETIKTGVKYNRQRAKEDSIRALTSGNTDFDVTSGFVSYQKEKLDAALEIQHQTVKELIDSYDYFGTIPLRDNDFAAGKIGYKLNEKLYGYVRGQGTMSGKTNNQVTLGGEYKLLKDYAVQLAETLGNLGNSTLFGLNNKRNDGVSSYSTIELGKYIDTGEFMKSTTGQSVPIGNNSNVYYETDYSSFRDNLLQGRILGCEHELLPGLLVGTNYERANYIKSDDIVNRDSGSVTINYLNPDIFRLSSRLEIRDDKTALERQRQWLTYNYLHWFITKDLSIFGKVGWSETREIKGKDIQSRFHEMGTGIVYRPIDFDKLNILAKYNYITDLPPIGQMSNADLLTDSKKHVIGVEGGYDICKYLGVVGKFAYRMQEDKVDSIGTNDSDTMLYIGRVNMHVTKKWDVCGEYRVLKNNLEEGGKSGWLAEVQRSVTDNFSVGAGYNFTNFDDDLTDSDDYDSSGWFVRVSGKY